MTRKTLRLGFPTAFLTENHAVRAAVIWPSLCALRRWSRYVRQRIERAVLYAIAWSLWAVVAKDPLLSMPIGLLVRWDDKPQPESLPGVGRRQPQTK